MRTLLIDFDGKLPNLALMKLSAWHRVQGDEVFLNNCDNCRCFYRSMDREPCYNCENGSEYEDGSMDGQEMD